MVKSLIYTCTAIILCVMAFIGVEIYLNKQFDDFHSSLQTLYSKVEDKTATKEDGNSVRKLWADKKKKLHIFIPHNDISYVDYWLSEACGLIYEKNYDLALANVEVLLEISKNLPGGYTLKLENIF